MTIAQEFVTHHDNELLAEIADLKAQLADLSDTVTSLRHCGAEKDGIIMALRAENERLYALYAERDIQRRYLQTEDTED